MQELHPQLHGSLAGVMVSYTRRESIDANVKSSRVEFVLLGANRL